MIMDDSCTPLYKDPPSGLKIGDLVRLKRTARRSADHPLLDCWLAFPSTPGIVIGTKTITYVDDIIFPNRSGLPVSLGVASTTAAPTSITWHEVYWAEKGIFRHVGKELEKL